MTWIKVTDELPPLNERVIFCRQFDGQFTELKFGKYCGEKMTDGSIAMDIGDQPPWWRPCTHWMPSPSEPEVEQ